MKDKRGFFLLPCRWKNGNSPLKYALCWGVCITWVPAQMYSQCNNTINTFPYVEDFEAGPGGWTSGGTADDWEWGVPDKPVIDAAGSGSRCWIVGGLSEGPYNVNERSYLLPPCFDFTNLANPMVAFQIFWETENDYDGTNLQYSTDGGNTWTNIGTTGQSGQCFIQNWYNNPNISNLTNLANPKVGWSGNIQTTGGPSCGLGDGSGEWRTATYCLSNLAGLPEVQLRFTFGAGSICNAYDGVAIDSFSIGEAPPLFEAFTINTGNCGFDMECAVVPLVADDCFGTLGWDWDFGDGTSSAAVSYTSHTYVMPGTYQVELTASGNCFSQSLSQTITVAAPAVLAFSSTDSQCGQNNGTATVNAIGGSVPLGYFWNTNPVQNTATATGLAAGEYSVTVVFPGNCTVTGTVTVDSDVPIPDIAAPVSLTITCAQPSVILSGSSATPGVSFDWSGPDGFSDSQPAPSVSVAGDYMLVVTDPATGCTATAATTVFADNNPPVVEADTDIILSCITLTAPLQGISASTALSWLWTGPAGFTATTAAIVVNEAGEYQLQATDTLTGCVGMDTVWVFEGIPVITYVYDTICQTTCLDFNDACLDLPGLYFDTLLTAAGCDSFIHLILTVVHCPWLDQACFVPNVFSPNDDGINDRFNAEGINFDTYEMRIFDRWGNYIYYTENPLAGWDGTYRDKLADIGIYAWYIRIRFINGNVIEKKGDVLLVR